MYGPGFRRARQTAIDRSGGVCQFCGQRAATDGHHWAEHYPSDADVTGDDITALCGICHRAATNKGPESGLPKTFRSSFRKSKTGFTEDVMDQSLLQGAPGGDRLI